MPKPRQKKIIILLATYFMAAAAAGEVPEQQSYQCKVLLAPVFIPLPASLQLVKNYKPA